MILLPLIYTIRFHGKPTSNCGRIYIRMKKRNQGNFEDAMEQMRKKIEDFTRKNPLRLIVYQKGAKSFVSTVVVLGAVFSFFFSFFVIYQIGNIPAHLHTQMGIYPLLFSSSSQLSGDIVVRVKFKKKNSFFGWWSPGDKDWMVMMWEVEDDCERKM